MRKKHGRRIAAAVLLCAAFATGCANQESELSTSQITARAVQEGKLETLAMPDTWANWKDTWSDLAVLCGISHTDTDMGSARELTLFQQGVGDLGDVGYEYGKMAEDQKLTLKYKTSYWEQIPDWAKDDDGDWVICYTGTLAFMIRDELVSTPPSSWQDLLAGDYLVAVNDPVNTSVDQYSIYAAAIAMGGGAGDLEPGIECFKTLARQGRLVTGSETCQDFLDSGAAVQLKWDFIALGYRDQAAELQSPAVLSARIPSDGSVTVGYASIINRRAAHPYAAMAAREYILSDAGQVNLAKGYATPIRSVKLPDDLEKRRIDRSQYSDAMVESALTYTPEIAQEISERWQEEVVPLLNGGTNP